MKKLILLVLFAAFAVAMQGQTTVRVSSETVGFWTLDADTMQIKKSDNVIKGSLYVPSFATDSAKISGCTFIVDGIATNGITIPPGEQALSFGADYAFMDSVKIIAKDEVWLMLMIKK